MILTEKEGQEQREAMTTDEGEALFVLRQKYWEKWAGTGRTRQAQASALYSTSAYAVPSTAGSTESTSRYKKLSAVDGRQAYSLLAPKSLT